MIPRRWMNRGDSQKSSKIDLPISNSSTETASMQSISSTDSSSLNGPRLPRTWRAYTAWLGCFFLMFNSWGLVNSYGTFSSYYTSNSLKSTDQMKLSLIGATQCFFVLLLSAPIGRLLDAGHSRIIIATGTFLVPFGMFMLSVAHPKNDDQAKYFKIWLTQGLVTGLGMACFFVTSSQGKIFHNDVRYMAHPKQWQQRGSPE
jgi:MCP family monocarboxylic acid transporter-like MFS transporter 10